MNDLVSLLCQLDEVNHAGNLDTYEQYWQDVGKRIERLYPWFTLAYAR
jgi:hypothetical protein